MVNNSTNIFKKKLTTTSHLHSLNTKIGTTTYDVGNPGPDLVKAKRCGRVKLVNGCGCK
jgi:hypothetical protein